MVLVIIEELVQWVLLMLQELKKVKKCLVEWVENKLQFKTYKLLKLT